MVTRHLPCLSLEVSFMHLTLSVTRDRESRSGNTLGAAAKWPGAAAAGTPQGA